MQRIWFLQYTFEHNPMHLATLGSPGAVESGQHRQGEPRSRANTRANTQVISETSDCLHLIDNVRPTQVSSELAWPRVFS